MRSNPRRSASLARRAVTTRVQPGEVRDRNQATAQEDRATRLSDDAEREIIVPDPAGVGDVADRERGRCSRRREFLPNPIRPR
jgi:hypothetical protein